MNTVMISGKLSQKRASTIAKLLNIPYSKAAIHSERFKNRELDIRLKGDFKGKTVIVFKLFNNKEKEFEPNGCLVKILFINNALKNAGAKRIINVMPYIPYMRQDKVKHSGECVSSKLVGQFLSISGCNTVITVDLHSERNKKHIKNVVDVLAAGIFADHIKKLKLKDITVVAPDNGAKKRAMVLGKLLSCPVKVLEKVRTKDGKVQRKVDSCYDIKNPVIYDDIIDSGSTILTAAKALNKCGCKKIIACCSHGMLSGDIKDKKKIMDKLKKAGITLITTDSLHIPNVSKFSNLKVLPVAEKLAEVLKKVLKR